MYIHTGTITSFCSNNEVREEESDNFSVILYIYVGIYFCRVRWPYVYRILSTYHCMFYANIYIVEVLFHTYCTYMFLFVRLTQNYYVYLSNLMKFSCILSGDSGGLLTLLLKHLHQKRRDNSETCGILYCDKHFDVSKYHRHVYRLQNYGLEALVKIIYLKRCI